MRKLRGKIPLREMARRLSISPSYLCDIENGRRIPSAVLFDRMLREYEEGEDWHVCGEEYQEPIEE